MHPDQPKKKYEPPRIYEIEVDPIQATGASQPCNAGGAAGGACGPGHTASGGACAPGQSARPSNCGPGHTASGCGPGNTP